MIQSWFEPHIFPEPLFPFFFDKTALKTLKEGPTNWHANIELIYCVSGEGVVKCDTRSCSIMAGDLVVVNTQIVHGIYTSGEVVYYYLIIDDEFCRANGISSTELSFMEHIRDKRVSAAFRDIADTIERQSEYAEVCRYAMIRCKVLQLLVLLCNDFLCEDIQRTVCSSVSLNRVKETMIYIQRNFSSKLTLDEVASNVGVCKNHLAREFRKYTRITIVEYINLQRCRNAQMCIQHGESLANAAAMSGFDNLSYFSRTYRKYIGYLPSETLSRSTGDQPIDLL